MKRFIAIFGFLAVSAIVALSWAQPWDWAPNYPGGQLVGAATLTGDLNANNNLILNIGAAGTDFLSGGGLNLAGPVNVSTTSTGLTLTDGAGSATIDVTAASQLDIGASGGIRLNNAVSGASTIGVTAGGGSVTLGPAPVRLIATGPDPVLSACGTTPSVVGTDVAGKVTIGTGVTTSCTVTFASAYAVAPACTVTGTGAANYFATTSTTVLTITSSADMASDVVMFHCIQL